MKKGDGVDCKCAASSYHDCGCGADWTPSEVYELREKLKVAREVLKENLQHFKRLGMTINAEHVEKVLAELGENINQKGEVK